LLKIKLEKMLQSIETTKRKGAMNMKQRQHLYSVDDLQTLLNQRKLLQQFAISRLGVFGSFARNEPARDIDLLIEDDLTLEAALQFKQCLEEIVDNSLDVMLKSWANPIVLHRAMKDIRYVER
jgi:predicted nucleotidyltransferase